MSNKEEKPADQNQSTWKDFIFNPRSGEFMGRTASSWALILLFYLVFYGFLAGLFTLTMWVMLQTLDDNAPKYCDRVPSPGLVIRPKTLDIVYNKSDSSKYSHYVQHLESFLQQYNDVDQDKKQPCVSGTYSIQDNETLPKNSCPFKRSLLGQCSGLHDPNFGYSEGKPCILVKMNRIIGLKPLGDPFINCTIKKEGSDFNMVYFPATKNFDLMYFPYYGKKAHETYVQPLIAVKLMLEKKDYDNVITVECKIEGSSNLKNDDERDKFLGRVIFTVKITE
ncbi:sodium/potassium-transporting ATPase subunit beta-3-like [Acipenser oxyrinchus oxyrinchus]|uniref:Sodium/potassium-transporting ATPase subunit beta n=1 Tax=Acipenser oxyrinchus oxyrinchus TaxID=40147 RepID=A0AAD8D2U0_ACIOX|nr:sodium/potassium-transporting ATPase subunit beta-3-like [Acipenser oxyrinchus oxyrinchus]